MNGTTDIRAIDVHAHLGPCRGGRNPTLDRFRSIDVDLLTARACTARVSLTIVSHLECLFPRGHADVIEGNRKAIQAVRGRDDLLMWAVLNPLLPDSFDQARELLQHPRCAGLKIHPEEHEYPIAERGSRVFEFAAAHKAIVLSHSGEPNSMPGDVLSAAAAFPEVAVILAHLGCGWDGDPTHQVRAVQAAGLPNVYVDTSSAMNVTPSVRGGRIENRPAV